MNGPEEQAIDGVDVAGMREYLAGEEVAFALLFGSYARGTADASSDVDVALRFADETDAHERFRRRNRIDAALQAYADEFVDVSDIASLPTPVAHAALRDGVRLVGDEQTIDEYRAQVEAEYESSSAAREAADKAFIERLARGDI